LVGLDNGASSRFGGIYIYSGGDDGYDGGGESRVGLYILYY